MAEKSDDKNTTSGEYSKIESKSFLSTSFLLFFSYPYLMLLCICWLTFGSYWTFDTPGAIQNQLTKWFEAKNITYSDDMNLALYSIYSWPNTILAFFGGFIIDRITGVRWGAFMFCCFILSGQIIFAFAIQYRYYWVAFFGRFVFGLGGESLTVAQNTYTIKWFDGPKLALAFGLVVSFARIGSSVNFVVTPKLANMNDGVPLSVWVGAITCALSFMFCMLAGVLDWKAEPRFANKEQKKEEPVELKQVAKFPASAWLLFTICAFFYICVLTFYTVASKIMQKTGHKYDDDTASMFLSIPNFVSIVASPTFGRVVDRYGRALSIVLLASCMMVVAHLAFFALAVEWIDITPVVIMLWLGVAYSLGAAALWPTLSCIVEERMLGTAYGCMTAVQNLALAIFPLIIGQLQVANGIKDTRKQYTIPILIFIGCAGVSICLTLILIGLDRRVNQGIMNASAEVKKQIKADREALLKTESSDMLVSPVGDVGVQQSINGQATDGTVNIQVAGATGGAGAGEHRTTSSARHVSDSRHSSESGSRKRGSTRSDRSDSRDDPDEIRGAGFYRSDRLSSGSQSASYKRRSMLGS